MEEKILFNFLHQKKSKDLFKSEAPQNMEKKDLHKVRQMKNILAITMLNPN